MKKIIFTGGGSAGHVTVNKALIPRFLNDNWSVEYIGSQAGIERELIESMTEIQYHSISTGKLRRYFDLQNILDPLKVVKGIFQAYRLIRKGKPDVIFSKGGFVSVPVVIAAWLNRVPIIIHESDETPGLANRISLPFATWICTTFEQTNLMVKRKVVFVGAIVRDEILNGNPDLGRKLCKFTTNKPVLLVVGGSLGARKINQIVRDSLSSIADRYNIIHICGKNNIDPTVSHPNYRQFEFVNDEFSHIAAMSDIVVSRAGANAIFEFLSLKKPMLLIPLSKQQSRGDQIRNAQHFKDKGLCMLAEEEELSEEKFVNQLNELYDKRSSYIENMSRYNNKSSIKLVTDLIKTTAK